MTVAKVSIIIPTYNRAQFVTKAIDSVLAQTFQDYELILIDDGSTDNTRATLEAYGGKVRYKFQKNAGVSSARNAGIREARGAWIAFLDSDDEWTTNYLSTQVRHIEEFPRAVAHITNGVTLIPDGGRINLFTESGFAVRFKGKSLLVFERPLRIIVKYGSWFTPSLVVRRDVLLEAGLYDEDLSIAEDLDAVARVALKGPFTFCNEELVEVYRRDESIENLTAQSRKRGIYRHKAFGKIFDNLLRSPGLTLRERLTVASAFGSTRRALGNVLIMVGRKAEARQSYKDSFCRYPSISSLVKWLATYLPGFVSRFFVKKDRRLFEQEDT